ncbi:MAG: cation diffusion facilitator family transporter [Propionibacteriaceae bacterium]|jgi:cation diffusion facilitator family transporter|nr:cation diffusion facilitator family transporter [Propionibacteriaceae bacterium]
MQSGTAQPNLSKFLWLSVAAALITLSVKVIAAWLTNSVGLWSDALESTVNLVAAFVALWAMRVASRPADHNHDFGHGKAEYLSAGAEGMMILIAAGSIIYGAVWRLIEPSELEHLSWGLALSLSASLINLGVGYYLLQTGKKTRSITLEADGKHLLTDVVTSVGVLVGIGLVMLTGWIILDPIIAIIVGLNILITGIRLARRSFVGLLDAALPPEDVEKVTAAVAELCADEKATLTQLRTRESGRQRFIYATVSVPGEWTVDHSHDLADAVEAVAGRTLAGAITFVHIEPM